MQKDGTLGVPSFVMIRVMIRTRDFLLFILIFLFLVMAIAVTIIRDAPEALPTGEVSFNDATFDGSYGATTNRKELNRQSIIARLREKLANATEQIEVSPSVEAPEVEEVLVGSIGHLQKCLYPDDALSIVPVWPVSDVQVSFGKGLRTVYIEEDVPVLVSTASSSVIDIPEPVEPIRTTLLSMPLIPIKLADTSCVPSEVIGVTNKGILIFNSDVSAYRSIPQGALVGFARDGFPIYGVYDGEVDACGGYDHPAGYRYTLSSERNYIVGCYVGTPNKFSL